MSTAIAPNETAFQESRIHQEKTPLIIGVCSAFTGIAVVSYGFRVLARHLTRAGLGIDDALAFVATLSLLAVNATACVAAAYGIGKHLIAVGQDPENFIIIGKSEFGIQVTYELTMLFGKMSIVFFLQRIFTTQTRSIQIDIWVVGVYIVLRSVAGFLYVFLHCLPVSKNRGVPVQCRTGFGPSVVFAVLNVVSDIGLIVVPLPEIWALQLKTAKKFAVSLIFLIGTLGSIVCIVKIPLLRDITNGVILTVIEPACMMICANAPAFTGLVRMFRERRAKKTSSYKINDDSYDISVKSVSRPIGNTERPNKAYLGSGRSESTKLFTLNRQRVAQISWRM